MSVKLIATGVDGQHLAPTSAAHPAVSGLAATASIQDELDAYNPLIPDGRNWKATMMLEYSIPVGPFGSQPPRS